MTGSAQPYGLVDRAVHRIAFATLPLQVSLADFEERLYAERLADIKISAPLFITALPRAGTTLLLELCDTLPEFCAHTYRDMPFVLCPLLWQAFSGGFRKSDAPRERAHGDGMMVSADSVEAFEEIIWRFFWRAHYLDDRIVPWGSVDDEEFDELLTQHMRKIIALRARGAVARPRYMSKNNANVARLRGLAKLYPDSISIVPFREPLQHAASLLRQHLRFLDVHAKDAFARFYTGAIGHFDFGANLRPLDFDSWLGKRRSGDATTLGFWLEYWTACYSNVLASAHPGDSAGAHIHLVSYDRLVADPQASLEILASLINTADSTAFCTQSERLYPARPHEVSTSDIDAEILARAQALHEELLEAAAI